VWNWRGTVGKAPGPNSDRRDVKGVIPDFDLVFWEGRHVIITFDADADKNEQVEIARSLLARELRTLGAEEWLSYDGTAAEQAWPIIRINWRRGGRSAWILDD
jgi:hypothetical protein